MNRHQEFEQLSAYVDGELDAAERARVETHVGGCAECRGTLEALQATVTEMRAMPEPEASPQDSWALRAAIARARRQPTRWQRWAVASGSAAAAAVLIVGGILLAGGGASLSPTSDAVALDTTDFDATTAGALLEQQISAQDSAGGGATTVAPFGAEENQLNRQGATGEAIGAPAAAGSPCAAELFDGQDGARALQRSITGTFEGRAAYLMIYRASDPERLELWVVAADDCKNVLFFARRNL